MFWTKKKDKEQTFIVNGYDKREYERLIRNFIRESDAARLLNEIDNWKKRLRRAEEFKSRDNGKVNDHTESYNLLFDFAEYASERLHKRHKRSSEISKTILLSELETEWKAYSDSVVLAKIDSMYDR